MTSPIRYPKLKMAQRYQVGNIYRPIHEVTAIPNVRRNVGIITEVLEDEHSIVIEADYGYKKGDSANIFIDIILKHKNMEANNPIQFIDFDISPRCGKKIDADVAVIYSRNSSSNTYYLRLPSKLNDVLGKGEYKYIRVAVNNLTNEVFFVLDKENGMPLRNKTGL